MSSYVLLFYMDFIISPYNYLDAGLTNTLVEKCPGAPQIIFPFYNVYCNLMMSVYAVSHIVTDSPQPFDSSYSLPLIQNVTENQNEYKINTLKQMAFLSEWWRISIIAFDCVHGKSVSPNLRSISYCSPLALRFF